MVADPHVLACVKRKDREEGVVQEIDPSSTALLVTTIAVGCRPVG